MEKNQSRWYSCLLNGWHRIRAAWVTEPRLSGSSKANFETREATGHGRNLSGKHPGYYDCFPSIVTLTQLQGNYTKFLEGRWKQEDGNRKADGNSFGLKTRREDKKHEAYIDRQPPR